MIRSGDHSVIVAGGMESMSNAPYALKKARFGYRLGDGALIDLMVHDGLTSSFDGKHMVEQASFVSRELGITREAQDEWALRSQQRASAAIEEGRFADEIVPVGEVAADEGPRPDTTLEKLARPQARLRPGGDDHRRERAGRERRRRRARRHLGGVRERKRGLEVLATIVAQGYVADEFAYLARTPAGAGNARARRRRARRSATSSGSR